MGKLVPECQTIVDLNTPGDAVSGIGANRNSLRRAKLQSDHHHQNTSPTKA